MLILSYCRCGTEGGLRVGGLPKATCEVTVRARFKPCTSWFPAQLLGHDDTKQTDTKGTAAAIQQSEGRLLAYLNPSEAGRPMSCVSKTGYASLWDL